MSRKDFIAIAAAIKIDMNRADDAGKLLIKDLVENSLCPTFKVCNPRFDRAKFLTACGIDEVHTVARDSKLGTLETRGFSLD